MDRHSLRQQESHETYRCGPVGSPQVVIQSEEAENAQVAAAPVLPLEGNFASPPPSARQRLMELGEQALSTEELLEVILSPAQPRPEAQAAVRELLAEYHTLSGMASRSPQELANRRGVGALGASRLKAAFALAHRSMPHARRHAPLISPSLVFERLSRWTEEPAEVAIVLCLDQKLRVVSERLVGRGTAGRCVLTPREVFLPALRDGAARVIFAHTHPSGDPAPSREDIVFTERLCAAGNLLGIPLVDHIVIGREGFRSLAELGYVNQGACNPRSGENASRAHAANYGTAERATLPLHSISPEREADFGIPLHREGMAA